MNVAALQKHLRDLADFLSVAGGGKDVVNGLNAIHDGLTSFATEKLETFAAFLVQAEEHRRTGVYTPPKGRGAARAKSPAGGPALGDVKSRIAALYQHATTATDEQINELLNPLEAQFKLDELKSIAAGVEAGGKVASQRAKGKVVAEIRRAIVDRRGIAQRSIQ